MKIFFVTSLLLQTLLAKASIADGGSIALTDVETSISGLKTLFTKKDTSVSVSGISWEEASNATTLSWETFAGDTVTDAGTVSLEDGSLPDSIDAGIVRVGSSGRTTIRVVLTVDDGSSAEASTTLQAFPQGVSILPLIAVLGFAMTTRMVEFSLFVSLFIGVCIITGEVNQGFKDTLETYVLGALADAGHVYVILFTLFLSGLVGMMERSGGMLGFTRDVARFATTARTGQFVCFCVGVFVFFDDYANVLLAGETMRPLLDALFISREKLSFLVDATAAPIASISPVSSWVGFEVGLIDDELEKIKEMVGEDSLRIKTTGFGIFLESIRFRYYPIFMLILIVLLIFSKRDYASMLIAERKTQVYKRTDGGDGAAGGTALAKANQPSPDQPLRSWNMILPIILLVFFIFYLLVKTGEDDEVKQTILQKIESGDSYQALLWGTMATAILTIIFYCLQIVRGGSLTIPTPSVLKDMFLTGNDDGSLLKPRLLLSVRESQDGFLHGMGRIFPALIVLTLAWAVGAMMVDVGANRLFASWIVGSVNPKGLPTISFLISLFMALATGTSWGTMSILFPLILIPTYQAADGDPAIFYATTAGILSGSVAGDHISPISDTTVLSSLACDCNLLAHVGTQAWYAIFVIIVSVLVGTLPIGYSASWPNFVSYLIGAGVMVGFVYGICVPVMSPTGRYDIITELGMRILSFNQGGAAALQQLKDDTIKACNGEDVGVEMSGEKEDPVKLLKEEDVDVKTAPPKDVPQVEGWEGDELLA